LHTEIPTVKKYVRFDDRVEQMKASDDRMAPYMKNIADERNRSGKKPQNRWDSISETTSKQEPGYTIQSNTTV
jgi:hypothetical protein